MISLDWATAPMLEACFGFDSRTEWFSSCYLRINRDVRGGGDDGSNDLIGRSTKTGITFAPEAN